ncbi:MAG: glycosyltransferase [Solobacterium sp.]|nr:glycosyltransferase [Solobacterium sp.]
MISVIVPLYNSENYLENCVNSILNNTYTDFEVILVDDGSKDTTLEIAKNLASKDKRIRVITSEHKGVSFTRNRGIDEAKGNYISFVDSDDEITPLFLEKLVSMMENKKLDWAICNSKLVYHNMPVYYNPMPSFDEKQIFEGTKIAEIQDAIFFRGDEVHRKNMPNAVLCLYKADIIKNNQIYFNESIAYGEDLLFNHTYSNYIERAGYTPEALYIIHRRSGSSMDTFYWDLQLAKLIDLFDEVYKVDMLHNRDISESQLTYFAIQLTLAMRPLAEKYSLSEAKQMIDKLKMRVKESEMVAGLKKKKFSNNKKNPFLNHILVFLFKHNYLYTIYLRYRIEVLFKRLWNVLIK